MWLALWGDHNEAFNRFKAKYLTIPRVACDWPCRHLSFRFQQANILYRARSASCRVGRWHRLRKWQSTECRSLTVIRDLRQCARVRTVRTFFWNPDRLQRDANCWLASPLSLYKRGRLHTMLITMLDFTPRHYSRYPPCISINGR